MHWLNSAPQELQFSIWERLLWLSHNCIIYVLGFKHRGMIWKAFGIVPVIYNLYTYAQIKGHWAGFPGAFLELSWHSCTENRCHYQETDDCSWPPPPPPQSCPSWLCLLHPLCAASSLLWGLRPLIWSRCCVRNRKWDLLNSMLPIITLISHLHLCQDSHAQQCWLAAQHKLHFTSRLLTTRLNTNQNTYKKPTVQNTESSPHIVPFPETMGTEFGASCWGHVHNKLHAAVAETPVKTHCERKAKRV